MEKYDSKTSAKFRCSKFYSVSALVSILAAACPFSVSAGNDVLPGNDSGKEVAINVVDDNEILTEISVVKDHESQQAEIFREQPSQVFTTVEQKPEFPGGDAALMKYLSTHLRYPDAAAKNRIQGLVVVKFVIQKDGSVDKVEVVRGQNPDLDNEAVRVVKSLPKFIPGKMNGQAVAVWYTLPIKFKLPTE